jgi:hypothetical protein
MASVSGGDQLQSRIDAYMAALSPTTTGSTNTGNPSLQSRRRSQQMTPVRRIVDSLETLSTISLQYHVPPTSQSRARHSPAVLSQNSVGGQPSSVTTGGALRADEVNVKAGANGQQQTPTSAGISKSTINLSMSAGAADLTGAMSTPHRHIPQLATIGADDSDLHPQQKSILSVVKTGSNGTSAQMVPTSTSSASITARARTMTAVYL